MAEVTGILYELGEISGKSIFIDGTKIESAANKYTFVWKKAVTKNQTKLFGKISELVSECETLYGLKIAYHNEISLQKSIETLETYIEKLKEYTKKIHVCGERNSYSKTDHDTYYCKTGPVLPARYEKKEKTARHQWKNVKKCCMFQRE